MKTLSLNIIICLIFSFQLVLAQGKSINNKYSENQVSLLDTKAGALYINSNLYNANSHAILNHQQIGNNVQIQQIGNNNSINSQLVANKIDASVLQNGDNNQVSIEKKSNSIYQKVIQQGNNNNINDFVPYTNYDLSMELFQKGNDQNIKNFGSNSISKDMKVIQSGNSASVIILNTTKL